MSGKKASQQLKRLLEGIERTSLVQRTEEERAADREAEELAERCAVRNLGALTEALDVVWKRAGNLNLEG